MAVRHAKFRAIPWFLTVSRRLNSEPRRDRSRLSLAAGVALGSTLGISPAHATVTISTGSTSHITCSAGVCVPTAGSDVLNVKDREKRLAAENVTITTTGSGVQADDIDIAAVLNWMSPEGLSLEAYRSISVTASVSGKGHGGISLVTNNGGAGGTLSFGPKGRIQFKNLSDALSINGSSYTLVDTLAALASAVENNSSGAFAFARSYDASKDGT